MQVPSTRAGVVRHSLRNGRLRAALVAYFAFNIAEWATWIALLVWAYDRGGVNGASAMALAQVVPAAILASPAATALGRLPRPTALTLGYSAQAIAYTALAIELALGLPVPAIVGTAIVSAVAVTLTRPVHNSLLPEISETTGDLTAGNAASGTAEAVATFVGPLASGLLLAAYGAGSALLLGGILLIVAAVAAASLLPGRAPAASTPAMGASPPSVVAVLRDPDARLFSALVGAEYALIGMLDILLVVLAIDLLGMSDAGPGLLNSALGAGAMLGAAATFLLVGRSRLAPAMVVAAVVAGGAIAGAGFAPTVLIALLLVAICGGGRQFFDVANRTFVQRVLPDRMLTAVFGLQEAMMMAGLALGSVAAPVLVALLGARSAYLAVGLFLPTVALLSWHRLARLDAATTIPLDVLARIQAVPILAVLPPRILERLALEVVEERSEAGALLVSEGEPGERFYIVESGTVAVSHGDELIRELGPGEWFGELALLRDVPRTASITVISSAQLWTLDRESFLAAVCRSAMPGQIADEHAERLYR